MSESPNKKHKKHKKHKHKKKHEEDEAEVDVDVDPTDIPDEDVDVVSTGQTSIKLKIKIGAQQANKKKNDEVDVKNSSAEGGVLWEEKVKGEDIFPTKKKGDDTSDEEQEWLDALEAGTLDDSGAVKKNLDESLLTSRQRALIHGKAEEVLLQLPSGYKQPEFTEEQLQRRQQRAKKRRDQAHEKQEKEKKQTLDRLLKKQESKMKRGKMGKHSKKTQPPGYRYSSNVTGDFICVPAGFQFPLIAQSAKLPPAPISCGVQGCTKLRKYDCSRTGIALCSLECYKRNLCQSATPITTS